MSACSQLETTEDEWIIFDRNQWDFCRCSRKAYQKGRWKCHIVCDDCPRMRQRTCERCECADNNYAGLKCHYRVCRHRNRTLCVDKRAEKVEECQVNLSWNRTEDSYDECDCGNGGKLAKSGECECPSGYSGILCQKRIPPTYKPWKPPDDEFPKYKPWDPWEPSEFPTPAATPHSNKARTAAGSSGGLSEAAVAGIIVGAIAAVAIFFFLCFCFCTDCLSDDKKADQKKHLEASERFRSERSKIDKDSPIPTDDLPPPPPMPQYVHGHPPLAPMYPYPPDGPMPGGPQFPGNQPFTGGPPFPAGPPPNYGPQGTPPVFSYPPAPNQQTPTPMFPSSMPQQPPIFPKSGATSASQAPIKAGPSGKALGLDNKSVGSGSASITLKSTSSARKVPPDVKVAGKMGKPVPSTPVKKTAKVVVSTKI